MQPKRFVLTRIYEAQGGTWGEIHGPDGFHAATMELAWRDNQPNISCIPVGEYIIRKDNTGKHRYAVVMGVKGRTSIELHPATWPSELEGCIALGESIQEMNDSTVLAESVSAMNRFITALGDEEAVLKIININQEIES